MDRESAGYRSVCRRFPSDAGSARVLQKELIALSSTSGTPKIVACSPAFSHLKRLESSGGAFASERSHLESLTFVFIGLSARRLCVSVDPFEGAAQVGVAGDQELGVVCELSDFEFGANDIDNDAFNVFIVVYGSGECLRRQEECKRREWAALRDTARYVGEEEEEELENIPRENAYDMTFAEIDGVMGLPRATVCRFMKRNKWRIVPHRRDAVFDS